MSAENSPVKAPRPFLFLGLALGATWVLGLPAVLAKYGVLPGTPENYMGLIALGALAPLLIAVLLARREAGGLGALFLWKGKGSFSPLYFPAALFFSGALFVLAEAAYFLAGGNVERWLYLPLEPERVIAMVLFSVGEEVGWRGYALPRLLPKVGPFRASLWIGLTWAAWHLMMFLVEGVPLAAYFLMVPFFIAGSLVFTVFYQKTNGSLLVAVLLHMGAHLNNSHRSLSTSTTPMMLHTIAFVLAAFVLFFFSPIARRGASGKR